MEPKTKRKRFLFEDTIEILVGSEEVKFVAHQDAICKRSKFFAAASSERWNQSQKPIKLLDECPVTFGAYLECVYDGCLDEVNIPLLKSERSNANANDSADQDGEPEKHEEEESIRNSVRLCNLSDKLGDLKTSNAVMDRIHRLCNQQGQIVHPVVVRQIWDSTLEQSPLRDFARDVWVWRASEFALEEDESWHIPKAFLLVLAQQNRQIVRAAECGITISSVLERNGQLIDVDVDGELLDDYRERCRCRYHQHDESCPPCPTTLRGEAEEGAQD